ncbi:hypothetical protein ALO43_101014 [Pseudomonas tremae]|uniref:Uncharacterized protein n=1 Tax=Pseudomonas tremae TaxID=200454 RepID=A0AA40P8G3_9PSED|nr:MULTISPECIES: hypothetical protein [Pseudomonas syringae group]KPZ06837.1 hypothetical protein ALO43_101014 [Pseudomonas tremae]RMO09619.1 hypothetical protein ALQ48_02702 [Pseudomonas coronafaciens pv. zizaniae]
MLSLIKIIHWLGNMLSLIIVWVAIVIIYNSHALRPLGLIGLTFVWMFGGSLLIKTLKSRYAERLHKIVMSIAPAGFSAKVQISDEAGRRYVGIDPKAGTAVLIDDYNGIQKVMPLSEITEWATDITSEKHFQYVILRFRNYDYPSITIPVRTHDMERITSQLITAMG